MKHKSISKKKRLLVYEKYHGHCAYCGCGLDYKEMQVDHIQSVYAHNGSDDIDNLMPACRMCNFYKSTFSIEDFRKRVQGINERLNKLFIYRLAIKYGLINATPKEVVFYFERKETRSMFCILREDLNEIIKDKVLDESFLELSVDSLCEKGLFSSFLSVLALNSILEADLFQFSNSKFGIEILEDLKRGYAKKEQLCLLSSCVIQGIKKIMDSNLIMSEREKNLYEALLNDYEKNGFDFPVFCFCLKWMFRGVK